MSPCDLPDWVPDLIPFEGDWSQYVDQIYAAFRKNLLQQPVYFCGRRVSVRAEPRDEGKEAGFWHAISEGEDEEARIPDLRRCERIEWVRALIEADSSLVCEWQTVRGSDRRIVRALPDFSYVVVLADRKKYVLFITAYCVEREHRRRKLESEWSKWVEAQKG